MASFVISAGVIGILLSLMLVWETADGADSEAGGPIVKVTTANHIAYAGKDGECTIKCDYHDVSGVLTMGRADLTSGQQVTWTKLLDDTGPDFIHCTFLWTSRNQQIDYDVYSENRGHIQPILTLWSVTEVGLFEQAPDGTGTYSLAIKWSG